MNVAEQDLVKLKNHLISSNQKSEELLKLIKKLESLCFSIDPFQQIDDLQLEKLKELGISPTLNPYQLTNTLVYLLEECLQVKESKNIMN